MFMEEFDPDEEEELMADEETKLVRQFNTFLPTQQLILRCPKDNPITEELLKFYRDNPSINDTYIYAKVNKDTVDVELAGVNEVHQYNDTGRTVFADKFNNKNDGEAQRITRTEPMHVKRMDAKDFFGTEVVTLADKLNRPIIRHVDIEKSL